MTDIPFVTDRVFRWQKTGMSRPLIALTLMAAVVAAAVSVAAPVQAQQLKVSPKLELPVDSLPRSVVDDRTADFIVAVVNSEPITNQEVRRRYLRVQQQAIQQGAQMPPKEQALRQVLEQLVNERAQVQYAEGLGMRVDDESLAQAEQQVAGNNKMSVEALHRRLQGDGIDLNQFRNELRQQVLLRQVREREVDQRVRVEESDIDQVLKAQRGDDLSNLMLDLSHVLVMVPEGASATKVEELRAKAQMVADKARSGTDFSVLAREYSDAPEGSRGGGFGQRTADRLPGLFVEATRGLKQGEIAGPIRSPAGFHVLKLNEKVQGTGELAVVQTRVHHILLRTGAGMGEAEAIKRLQQLRQDIESAKTSFEAAAREFSQDGSAESGGDLGWVGPGQFVPEFESVMNALPPGQVSDPVVSRFGVHLIRVDQRREQALSQADQRTLARNVLKEQKSGEALTAWAQDVRSRAYVEYREDPRL